MIRISKGDKKGFTLMELLIVIAIIVVLVAIGIPIFVKQLEKARETTDIANMRDAKAAVLALEMSEEEATGYYDAKTGQVLSDKSGIDQYGKGTKSNAGGSFTANTSCELCQYRPANDYRSSCIYVSANDEGDVHVHWEGIDSEEIDYDSNESIGKYVLSQVQKKLAGYLEGESAGELDEIFKAKSDKGSSDQKMQMTLPNGQTVDVIVYSRNYDNFQYVNDRMKSENTATLIYNRQTGKISTIVYYNKGNYSSWSITDKGWRENDYYKQ